MKIILVSVTTIPAGVALKLTPHQIDARVHAIEAWGDDPSIYVGTQALVFKTGEEIEIVGDLPKGILPIYDQITEVDKQIVKTEAAIKHKRSAKAEPAISRTL